LAAFFISLAFYINEILAFFSKVAYYDRKKKIRETMGKAEIKDRQGARKGEIELGGATSRGLNKGPKETFGFRHRKQNRLFGGQQKVNDSPA
jgi:hypothetical protein